MKASLIGKLRGPLWETYIKANTAMLINDSEANEKNKNSSHLERAALAPGARVVKALNTIIVPNLVAERVVNGAKKVLFISADDDDAKKNVEALIAGFGLFRDRSREPSRWWADSACRRPLAGRNFLEEGERHQ